MATKLAPVETADLTFPTERAPDQLIRHACLTNQVLELILFPTEQCNFRCTYCYEDFEIGNMKPPVINGICRLLEKRAPTLGALKLSYFGGEPLLNMRAIRTISQRAKDLQREHGFDLTANATTNAYLLTPELLTELIDFHCPDFQVSLDGWGVAHDETRRQRNGTWSFEHIWANLLALKATDLNFKITLRLHMTPANAHSLEELVTRINEHLGDPRFSVLFKKVGNWGGTNPDHPEVYGSKSETLVALHQRLVDLARRVTELGIDETGGNVAPRDQSKVINEFKQLGLPTICYAARSNSLAIRANGRINKCTVALSNPKNDIGSIDESGDLHIDPEKLAPWLQGATTLDLSQLSCPAARIVH